MLRLVLLFSMLALSFLMVSPLTAQDRARRRRAPDPRLPLGKVKPSREGLLTRHKGDRLQGGDMPCHVTDPFPGLIPDMVLTTG